MEQEPQEPAGAEHFVAEVFYSTFQLYQPRQAEYEVHCEQLLALPRDVCESFIFEFLYDRDRMWFLLILLDHLRTDHTEQLDPGLLEAVKLKYEQLSYESAHFVQPGALRLPDDLSAEVLKYLPAKDRANLSTANHQSRKAVTGYEIGHLPSEFLRDSERLCASAQQLDKLLLKNWGNLRVIDMVISKAGKGRFRVLDGKPSLDSQLATATRGMLTLAEFLEMDLAGSLPRATEVSAHVRSAQNGLEDARKLCQFQPPYGPRLKSVFRDKDHYERVYQLVQRPCDELLGKLASLRKDSLTYVNAKKRQG